MVDFFTFVVDFYIMEFFYICGCNKVSNYYININGYNSDIIIKLNI